MRHQASSHNPKINETRAGANINVDAPAHLRKLSPEVRCRPEASGPVVTQFASHLSPTLSGAQVTATAVTG
jgi:hypothetical protein